MSSMAFCSTCGILVRGDRELCPKCNSVLKPSASKGTPYKQSAAANNPRPKLESRPNLSLRSNEFRFREPAGFWERWFAYSIDFLLLWVSAIIVIRFGIGLKQLLSDPSRWTAVFVLAQFSYEILMTSSICQGTAGKYLLGLKVTDGSGEAISLVRSVARVLAKQLSHAIPLFIGFIVAGLRADKRALHDGIAGTRVVRGESHFLVASSVAIVLAIASVTLPANMALSMVRSYERYQSDTHVVGDLRTLNAAIGAYKAKFHRYPLTLVALRPAPAQQEDNPGSGTRGPIDVAMTMGFKNGYFYDYNRVVANGKEGYTIYADPTEAGDASRHFYSDQTGIIRSDAQQHAGSSSDTFVLAWNW